MIRIISSFLIIPFQILENDAVHTKMPSLDSMVSVHLPVIVLQLIANVPSLIVSLNIEIVASATRSEPQSSIVFIKNQYSL